MLLAQHFHGLSFTNLAIIVIVFIAVVAIVAIFVKASGVSIPPWVVQVLWVVVAAVVCIVAILFLVWFASGGP